MKIEIWSDVVCPWCYIGKRRFEEALENFQHRDQVEVTWRSYQLDPSTPRDAEGTVSEHLAEKYRTSPQQVAKMMEQVTEVAAEVGLEYHLDRAKAVNTFDAHRLIHLAEKHHLQDAMKERLLKAYFTETQNVNDGEVLVALAVEVGLDADEVRAALASEAYADGVKADIQRAANFGITGVPFFAIDEKYGVSGAQPTEVFTQVLEKAWAESHPLINVVGTPGAGSCDGDSCSI